MRALLCLPLLVAASPAFAQVEQLTQVEPGKGEWQLEYFGAYGGHDEHAVEAIAGVTDKVAIAVDAEFSGDTFEAAGLGALYRFADPEHAPVGLGVMVSGGIDRDGEFSGAELRGIVDLRRPEWWVQGDLMLRHSREHGHKGTGVAYATSVQRAIGHEIAWLGIEASGRLARISGDHELAPEGEHYVGPSLTVEFAHGDIELGAAWLQRVAGEGPKSQPRVFVQFTF
jgi:hypothetical protein